MRISVLESCAITPLFVHGQKGFLLASEGQLERARRADNIQGILGIGQWEAQSQVPRDMARISVCWGPRMGIAKGGEAQH